MSRKSRSDSGRLKCRWLGVAILVPAVLVGCGSSDEQLGCSTGRELVAERAVDTTYEYVPGELPADPPALVVEVSNSEDQVERVQLMFDGKSALDVDLPPDADCMGGQMHAFAYDRPPGAVRAELTVQGSTSTTVIDLPAAGTKWAVVDVQSQPAWSDLKTYDSRPFWD